MKTSSERNLIVRMNSPYQKIELRKTRQGLALYLNDEVQVHSLDDRFYHEAIATLPMMLAKNVRRIAVLGGGDGLAVRNIFQFQGLGDVFLIELDEAVLELCRTNPHMANLNEGALSNPQLNIVVGDAFNWFFRARGKFDVVILDIEDNATDQPAEVTVEIYERFFAAVREKLSPGGILQITLVDDPRERRSVEDFYEATKSKLSPAVQRKFSKQRSFPGRAKALLQAYFKHVLLWPQKHKKIGPHINFCISNKPMTKFNRWPTPKPLYLTRKLLKRLKHH